MNRDNVTDEMLDAISDCGLDVYQSESCKTYCFYTDGIRIAYFQNCSVYGWTLTTVHKPCKEIGNGFGVGNIAKLDRESLERGFSHAPNWACHYIGKVKKYKDAAAWLAAQRVLKYTRVRKGAIKN